MNIDKIKEVLLKRDGLSNTLGMEFISTPDPDTCQARMKVDERNRQISDSSVAAHRSHLPRTWLA